MQQSILSLLFTGSVMNKICVCGKELPYKTEEDIRFFNMYHGACTDDQSALDVGLVY